MDNVINRRGQPPSELMAAWQARNAGLATLQQGATFDLKSDPAYRPRMFPGPTLADINDYPGSAEYNWLEGFVIGDFALTTDDDKLYFYDGDTPWKETGSGSGSGITVVATMADMFALISGQKLVYVTANAMLYFFISAGFYRAMYPYAGTSFPSGIGEQSSDQFYHSTHKMLFTYLWTGSGLVWKAAQPWRSLVSGQGEQPGDHAIIGGYEYVLLNGSWLCLSHIV